MKLKTAHRITGLMLLWNATFTIVALVRDRPWQALLCGICVGLMLHLFIGERRRLKKWPDA